MQGILNPPMVADRSEQLLANVALIKTERCDEIADMPRDLAGRLLNAFRRGLDHAAFFKAGPFFLNVLRQAQAWQHANLPDFNSPVSGIGFFMRFCAVVRKF